MIIMPSHGSFNKIVKESVGFLFINEKWTKNMIFHDKIYGRSIDLSKKNRIPEPVSAAWRTIRIHLIRPSRIVGSRALSLVLVLLHILGKQSGRYQGKSVVMVYRNH